MSSSVVSPIAETTTHTGRRRGRRGDAAGDAADPLGRRERRAAELLDDETLTGMQGLDVHDGMPTRSATAANAATAPMITTEGDSSMRAAEAIEPRVATTTVRPAARASRSTAAGSSSGRRA